MSTVINKILGYTFYAIGVILSLSVIGTIEEYIRDFANLFGLFSSDLTAYQRGQITGSAIFKLLILFLIYLFFKWGTKGVSFKKKDLS